MREESRHGGRHWLRREGRKGGREGWRHTDGEKWKW